MMADPDEEEEQQEEQGALYLEVIYALEQERGALQGQLADREALDAQARVIIACTGGSEPWHDADDDDDDDHVS